jgi:hypothetical protein
MEALEGLMIQKLSMILVVSVLVACGGGGVSPEPVQPPDPPDPPIDPTYETIFSTANETSVLTAAGFVLPSGGTDAVNIAVPRISGSVKHDAGPLVLDDGVYVFNGAYVLNDPNDPNGGGTFEDSNGANFSLSEFQGGGYDYVLRFLGTYNVAGTDYASAGVGGIATETEFVPTDGVASYSGDAIGSGADSSGTFELTDGDMAVTINFGTGNVTLVADGFTDTGAPVDSITVLGATMDGNVFSGGGINLRLNGAFANGILGPNSVTKVEGGVYGWDPVNDIPDEVGGVVLRAGDDGYVNIYFAAD